MEKFLQDFHTHGDIVAFCLRSIAFSHELEEDPPVDPLTVLTSELISSVFLFQYRYVNLTNSLDTAQYVLSFLVFFFEMHGFITDSKFKLCSSNVLGKN